MNTDFFLKQMDDAFVEAKTKELMAKWAERRQEAKQGLAIAGPLPDAAKGGPLNAREVDGELHLDLYHPIARAGSLMSLIGAVTPEDFSSAFALADKDAHVRIFVDSPGGALLPARAIMAQMERHEGRITWTADGMAASAAALISLAADERVANKGSRYLMHRSWATATGDANVHEEIVAELRKNDDEIAAEYAAVSQPTKAQFLKMMDKETLLTPKEAKSLGLVDRISGTNPLALYAEKAAKHAQAQAEAAQAQSEQKEEQPEQEVPPCKSNNVRIAYAYAQTLAARPRPMVQ